MKSNTRACIAYIAACLNGESSSHVYDHSRSKFINVSGNVSSANVNIYDYERGCYISGSPGSLYDYGNGAHIQLTVNGSQFTGYDYDSGNHFSGSVNGSSVNIYDYEKSAYFNYSV